MANAVGDRIIVTFGWQGPNNWLEGSSHKYVDVINLIFKNANTEVSIPLPDNIAPETTQKFPFTLRKYQEFSSQTEGRTSLTQETHHSLRVTIDQIRHLTINAGFFEKKQIWASRESVSLHTSPLRDESVIVLQLPVELEIGQIYLLKITSKGNFPLSACLIKEQVKKEEEVKFSFLPDDSQYLQDQEELFQVIGGPLLTLIDIKIVEFNKQLQVVAPQSCASVSTSNQALKIAAIRSEMKKLEKEQVKELMLKVRQTKIEWSNKQTSRSNLEKELLKMCFNALGTECFKNIIRSSLEALLEPITPEIRSIIEEIVAKVNTIFT